MKIKTLVENTSISERFNCEHGLSLYIETKNHKLLFDLGASILFVENAEKIGVDLSDIDLVVISHGHYDHGGGLKAFLDINNKAKIYFSKNAFNKHYTKRQDGKKVYIGLDKSLMSNDRIIYVDDQLKIDDGLQLFSNVQGRKMYPSGNKDVLLEIGSSLIKDDFKHEQNLFINEDGIRLLIVGCAHKGIINIIDHLVNTYGISPNYIIGGFHFHNRSANKDENPFKVITVGEYLKNTRAKFYTCHCTGIRSYKILKEIMGEQIQYLATGSQLII